MQHLWSVWNASRQTLVADNVRLAATSRERCQGLLGMKSLARGHGLWIRPCSSIHTFGMSFAIDVVYLDRRQRVRKVVRRVSAWRISCCFVAHSVIELPAGLIEETGTRRGDQLRVTCKKTSTIPN